MIAQIPSGWQGVRMASTGIPIVPRDRIDPLPGGWQRDVAQRSARQPPAPGIAGALR